MTNHYKQSLASIKTNSSKFQKMHPAQLPIQLPVLQNTGSVIHMLASLSTYLHNPTTLPMKFSNWLD
jgi:hypothetical protein